MKIRLTLLLCFIFSWSYGQQELSGTVIDEKETPLAFVNIIINQELQRGTMTDINGKFSIPFDSSIQRLQFRYIGYQNFDLLLEAIDFRTPLEIQLQRSENLLATAEILAGENPAHRIIKKATKNRALHHPNKMKAFRCESYNKMVSSIIPSDENFEEYLQDKTKVSDRDSAVMRIMELSQNRHIMIMESVTDKKFARPNKEQEVVLYNKVSGFKTPEFALLANELQPFSFYEDYIKLLDKNYLNPISRGSTKKYFFEIKDTLYQAQDSIFVIAFRARKGKIFNSLKGLLYIHTNGYAIQNVIAQRDEEAFADIKIEQSYRFVDNQQWFPHQLNFEILIPRYISDFVSLKFKGNTYIRKVKLNPVFPKWTFREDEVIFSDSVRYTSDTLLALYREDSLNQVEYNTYRFMDSISQTVPFEAMMDLAVSFGTGKYKINAITLDLNRLLAFNDHENVRLGLGLHSNNDLSKHFSLGGYFAYGFRDKAWKYGGDFRLFFPYIKIPQLQLKASYSEDIKEPGRLDLSTSSFDLLSQSIYLSRVDRITEKSLSISGDIFKNFNTKIGLSQQHLRPLYPYQYLPNGETNEAANFNLTEIQFAIRFAYGEKFMRSNETRVSLGTRFPVLEMNYARGLNSFLGGEHDYHRLSIALNDDFLIRSIGKIKYRLELGWTEGNTPYPKLFNTSGVGEDFSFLAFDQIFQTMTNYEFLSDRFVQLYFDYNLGNIFYKTKYSQPSLSLTQNTAIGFLDRAETHQGIEFKTLEHGYFESGIVLNDLIRYPMSNIAYLGFGAGVYYRYGAYQLTEQIKNIAIRAITSFSF